jgi:hypothetical protein
LYTSQNEETFFQENIQALLRHAVGEFLPLLRTERLSGN